MAEHAVTTGIQCRHVTKRFKTRTLFADLDFDLALGEHCALIGENGAGKTTFLKILAGLTTFDSGSISVIGHALTPKRHTIPARVGVVFDGLNLLPQFTGLENLRLLARLCNIGIPNLPALLAEVGLDPADRRKVAQYSLGMRQRLNLAQSMVPRPQLLLLDEPSNGLDPEGVQWLIRWIRGLSGVTVIMASHRLDEVGATCSAVRRITDGHIVYEGDPPSHGHVQ